jgi:predicted amino acid dehydrogenase
MVESLTAKNIRSNIQLHWKENGTSLDNIYIHKISGIVGGTPSVAKQVQKNNEGESGKPQLIKRQRKKPALKVQDFLWQI